MRYLMAKFWNEEKNMEKMLNRIWGQNSMRIYNIQKKHKVLDGNLEKTVIGLRRRLIGLEKIENELSVDFHD